MGQYCLCPARFRFLPLSLLVVISLWIAGVSLALPAFSADAQANPPLAKSTGGSPNKQDVRHMPDSYWRHKLDADTYNVTRCSLTEPPFHNKYWNNHAAGQYRCSNCGALLFDSHDKFDSHTGWPSFTQSQGSSVDKRPDYSAGMLRDEIICKHCGAHLGHVFADGPEPSGQRYCVNSASLTFQANKQPQSQAQPKNK